MKTPRKYGIFLQRRKRVKFDVILVFFPRASQCIGTRTQTSSAAFALFMPHQSGSAFARFSFSQSSSRVLALLTRFITAIKIRTGLKKLAGYANASQNRRAQKSTNFPSRRSSSASDPHTCVTLDG